MGVTKLRLKKIAEHGRDDPTRKALAVAIEAAGKAQGMIERGREIAAQLAPIRSTLTALWAEPTPAAWDAAFSHDKGAGSRSRRSSRRRRTSSGNPAHSRVRHRTRG